MIEIFKALKVDHLIIVRNLNIVDKSWLVAK